jgi:hypothetical protein
VAEVGPSPSVSQWQYPGFLNKRNVGNLERPKFLQTDIFP